MTARQLRLGISACLLHEDPTRELFAGRRLLYMEQSMASWIVRASGHRAVPLLLPFGQQAIEPQANALAQCIDGLILHGGADVCPLTYHEQPLDERWSGDPTRDAQEIALVRACMAQNIPILGICRGHQLLNVALGGTLYQDIATQRPEAITHRDAARYHANHHALRIEPGSDLARLMGRLDGRVNSVHHQAIKDLAPGLVVQARCAEDGLIEAVRLPQQHPQDPYVVGVQWHPEFQEPHEQDLLAPEPLMQDLMEAILARV